MYFLRFLCAAPRDFFFFFFFFNDTATTEIYTLSLHDALPILPSRARVVRSTPYFSSALNVPSGSARSEEHTSELQSHVNLVCRLLLEKKKKKTNIKFHIHKYAKKIATIENSRIENRFNIFLQK